MAELRCQANTCTYNRERCCCKGEIVVGGRHAQCTDDTCCESFSQRRGESMMNAMAHPSPTISVDCEVSKCIYNANYKCTADHVEISGMGVDTGRETCCNTFKEK